MEIRSVKQYGYLSQAEKVAMVTVKGGVVNQRIVESMAALVPQRLKDRTVFLVPIPDHNGSTDANGKLAVEIARLTGNIVLSCIGGQRRESHHNYKRHHKDCMAPEDLRMFLISFGSPVIKPWDLIVFIDNVSDSGATLEAARRLLRCNECMAVVYAATNNNKFNNKKDLQIMAKKTTIKEVKGKTVLVCGNCGAEVPLPEHTSLVSGMTLAQDSGLGRVVLPTSGDGKGMDMASFMHLFTIGMQQMCADPEMRRQLLDALQVNEHAQSVRAAAVTAEQREEAHREAEEIRNKSKHGYEKNTYHNHLVRQMFDEYKIHKGTYYFNAHLNGMGSDYMWQQLRHNLNIMKKVEKTDPDAFAEMHRWWTVDVYLETVHVFISALAAWCDKNWSSRVTRGDDGCYHRYIRTHVFRGNGGKSIDTEVSDAIMNLRRMRRQLLDSATDFGQFYAAYIRFDDYRDSHIRFKAPKKVGLKMYKTFKEAFKGWGAYCTLQNIIMYDDVRLSPRIINNDATASDVPYSKWESLTVLQEMMRKLRPGKEFFHYTGYMLLAVLEETVKANNYDYEAAREEFLKSRGLK